MLFAGKISKEDLGTRLPVTTSGNRAYAINPKLNVWSVLTNHSSFSTRMLSMITYQESLWLVFIQWILKISVGSWL